jgi:hypothetical protein
MDCGGIRRCSLVALGVSVPSVIFLSRDVIHSFAPWMLRTGRARRKKGCWRGSRVARPGRWLRVYEPVLHVSEQTTLIAARADEFHRKPVTGQLELPFPPWPFSPVWA